MNIKLFSLRFSFVLLIFGSIQTQSLSAQVFEDVFGATLELAAPVPSLAQDEEKKEAKKDTTPLTDTATLQATEEPENKQVRFHMWDGTVITGEVAIDQISMDTEFGILQIPIERIRKMSPGLDSYPELDATIQEQIEALGDKNFEVREKATRALSAMGTPIRNILKATDPGNDAEQKKRLAGILKDFDELDDDGEGSNDSMLIRGDTLVTPEFAIVGKIVQQEFTVQSKFGQLKVQLGDIKKADRPFKTVAQEVKKTVTVGAEVFFQRSPLSTRIRVNKGDKIVIKGEGTVNWTNWSKTSGPTGMANQQKYQGINSGTLCARIGSSGKVIKIGSKGDFVAKKAGVLYLAIAMNDNLQSQSYRWTGNYKAKIQVKPAQ